MNAAAEPPMSPFIVNGARIVLRNLLTLLGITAPEKM